MRLPLTITTIIIALIFLYGTICFYFIFWIGFFTGGTIDHGYWIIQMCQVVAMTILMILCLAGGSLNFIKTRHLVIVNIAVCLAYAFRDPFYFNLLSLAVMAIWSAMFWLVFYVARSAPWAYRIYLSAFCVLAASYIVDLIPPNMSPIYILWWAVPILHGLTEGLEKSIRLLTIPFIIFILYRIGWKWTKPFLLGLVGYTSFFVARWALPFLSPGSSGITDYFTRIIIALFFITAVYSGLAWKRGIKPLEVHA
jgi:hypothetical protein